ncbi:MAG TPA: hypothetical protein VLV83_19645 [Acidobacteriota bacterium]|nr:hypothetical protein [Acidobacteriota bacterium]
MCRLEGAFEAVTFLRNPIDRIISQFDFWRNYPAPSSLGNDAAANVRLAQKPFAEIFDSPRPEDRGLTRNAMARILLGKPGGRWPPAHLGSRASLLARAKERIDSFTVCGITEMIGPSLLLLADKFGWCPLHVVPKLNVTEHRTIQEEIDDSEMERLHEENQLDLEIYRYARRRLRERIAGLNHPALLKRFENRLERCWQCLPSGFSMRGPLFGSGWYEREDRAGGSWRWTGPDRCAVVYLRLAHSRPSELRVELRHTGLARARRLKLRLWGTPLPFEVERGPGGRQELRAKIPASAVKGRTCAKIELIMDETFVPAQALRGAGDRRRLGVAVARIGLH